MTKLLHVTLFFVFFVAMAKTGISQCTNPTIPLPDASTPVNGNPATAYCSTFTFNPSLTGLPTGLSMQLQHTWQGDLSIFIIACNNTLLLLNRPGVVGSCTGGCPCGNSNDIGSPGNPSLVVFSDGGGPDPENGIALGGGNYGITADNSCGVGSPGITSFAALWAGCPPGPITAQVCIADHALADVGVAANVTLVYPTPVVCGCTNPNSPNYNPNANVDDGSCLPNCATLIVNANASNAVACPGGTVSLSSSVSGATGPVTYSWSGPNVGFLSSNTSPNPTVNIPPNFSGSLTFNLTVVSGPCGQNTSVTITVTPPPPPTINGPPGLCPGQGSATLFVSGSFSSYAWSVPPGGSGPSVTVNQPGTYSVTVTNANGCPSNSSITIPSLPVPMPQITGPPTVCVGGTATLNAGPGFSSYIWSTGSTGQTTTVNQPGFYSVTVTSAAGCTGSGQFTLTTAPAPIPGIFGGNQICPNGGTLTLSAEQGYSNFQWSNGTTGPTTTITGPGFYSLTATDAQGCIGTGNITVTLLSPPAPTIQGNLILCPGQQSSLTVLPFYNSYQWSNGQTGQAISVNQAGIYAVTATTAQGCNVTTAVQVTSVPAPNPTISGDLTICPGQTTALNAGPGFSSYLWSDGSTGPVAVFLNTGTYSVTVTNSNGCQGVATVNVTPAVVPAPVISGPALICPGSVGTLNAGAGFSTYAWSTGATSAQLSVNAAGNYAVTVTNSEGCTGSASFTVGLAPVPNPVISGNLSFCQGTSTVLNAGAGFTTYAWSNGGTGASNTVSAPGTYTVTVTNSNGCSNTASVVVTATPNPAPAISGALNICPGSSATLTVGGNFSSYTWSTGAQTPSISASTAGTYSVTVLDALGCTGNTSVAVQVLTPPAPQISGASSFCFGANTVLDAGGGFASYLWSAGGNSQLQAVSNSGNYTVTVTDSNGCTGSASLNVTERPEVVPTISGGTALCLGQTNLTLTASSGYASYSWSNATINQAITVNAGGTYTVTVVDNAGCSGIASTSVTANTPPTVSISGVTQYCQGNSTTLSATPGFNSYLWSNGSSVPGLTVNSPGAYGVTVTDNNGCTAQTAVQVIQNPNPVPAISGLAQICTGGQTTLSVPGNFSAYSWSNSGNQASIPVSAPGNYSVTVTDSNGCQGSASVSVTQVPQLTPLISGVLSICAGETTTLTANGGNFSGYSWSNGGTGANITANTSGTYGLTVTDANGCSASTSAALVVNALPSYSIAGTPAFCSGLSTTLNVPTGFASYAWSTGGVGAGITVNAAGTYSITVTNAAGCTEVRSISVTENPNPLPDITGVLQICLGGSTVLNSGIGSVNYQWSNGASTPTISVNTAGNYGLTVTDANGCVGTDAVTITQVPQLQPNISGVLYFCAGGSTQLNAGGGYASYAWSNSNSSQQVTVSNPGTYSVTVTDANGCSGQTSASVIERPLPAPQISGVLEYCEGSSTTLSSAVNFPTYSWSNGASSSSVTLNTPGTYRLTVTDSFGCVGSTSAQVVEHPLVYPTITGTLSFCQGLQTALNAGSGFVTYQWSNSASTPGINVTSGGSYSVTVTDAFGCVTNAGVSVTEFPVTAPQITGATAFCSGNNVVLDAGAGYASYVWSNNTTSRTATISQGGFYSVTATDINGCVSNSGIQVTQNPLPNVVIGGSASFCIGGYTTLNAGGGFAQYLWSSGATTPTLQVSQPGLISVTVTDANGCSASDDISVIQDTELSPQINGNLQFCPGTQTVLDAGPGYATYQWSNNSGAQTVTVNQPGTYSVSVTDTFGCAGSGSVQVSTFPQPQPTIAGTPSFCAGNSTMLSSASVFSSYQWSTGAIQPQIMVNAPGTFRLTVTDSNGCVASTSQTVQEFPLPVFGISGVDYFCAGASTAISVPSTFAGYQWSGGQQTPGISVAAPGSYTVTVTNSFGCVSSRSIQVAQIPLPAADAGPARELTCNFPTATLGGPGTSQGAAFTYQWSGPGINMTNSNLRQPVISVPGAYSLVVTDTVHGCVSTVNNTSVADLTALPAVSVNTLDTLDCVTPSVVVSGSGSATGSTISYQWFGPGIVAIPGANTISYVASNPGQYTLRVTNTYTGCISERMAEVFQDIQYPMADAGTPRHLNCITTADALNGAGSSSGNSIAYFWSTIGGNIVSGSTAIAPVVNRPGLYILRVTNQRNGCVSLDSVTVTQDIAAPTSFAGQDQEIDCLHPTVPINGAGSSTGPLFRYEWTLNGNATVLSNALGFDISIPGAYTLRVINTQNGCSASDIVVVTENPARPRGLQVLPDNPTCFGDTDGSILLGAVTGGTPPFLYSVNGAPFRSQTFYPNLGAGVYSLVVQDATGCEYSIDVSLRQGNDLVLDLGPDQFIRIGQRAQIEAQYNIPDAEVASFMWNTADTLSCRTCPNIDVRPFNTTVYAATLVDENGCRITERVTIFVANPREVFIPNAFSPNNDGINDRLMIFAGEDVAFVRAFMVFNRWGESVFEVYDFPPNDPAYGWDGNHRGRLYNSAVFAYFAEVQFIDGSVKLFKGDVTLMK